MIVHFEGLDLAGKSTVCRRFAAQAPGDWDIRRNRLSAWNPVHDAAEELRLRGTYAPATVGEAYLAALTLDLETWSPPEGNRVQDSTIVLRSYVYHTFQGAPRLAERFRELLADHPRFDCSFVCRCDREVRLARLARRRTENLGPEDFLVRDDPVRFAEMDACLVETAVGYFGARIVDTSNLEESENLDWLISQVPGLPSS